MEKNIQDIIVRTYAKLQGLRNNAQLVKLVIVGITKVNFKSNSSTNYLLVDRQMIEQVLRS